MSNFSDHRLSFDDMMIDNVRWVGLL